MPSSAQRRVASTANRTLAVFDCPYARTGRTSRKRVVEVVEDDGRAPVPAGADRDDPGVAGRGQGVVQPEREREVAQVVGRELHLLAAVGAAQLRIAMTPALLTRMCSGPSQAATNAATRRGRPARAGRPRPRRCRCVARMSAATRSPSRSAHGDGHRRRRRPARARAVSTPMPEAPPVTMARLPVEVDARDHLGGGESRSRTGS